jgi:hypothetical protein
MKAEMARRKSFTDAVLDFLRANQGRWIQAIEFEAVGGRQAWRTRLSEARLILEREGGTVENRQRRSVVIDGNGRKHVAGAVISEYRYLPAKPLGRSAEQRIEPRLF